MWIDLLISFILIASIFTVLFSISRVNSGLNKKEEKEFLNRLKWQHEVYGFEFYTFGYMGMGKHRKNATKEQNERWIRDRKGKDIQKNYEDWKKEKGL